MLHRTIYIAEWISVQFRKFSRKFSREKHFGREIFPCCVFLHINARTIYIYETYIRETIATMFTIKQRTGASIRTFYQKFTRIFAFRTNS